MIGNICLVVERDLFGQEPLNQIHGPETGEKLADDLRRLETQMCPMMGSLAYLDGRVKGGKTGTVTVEKAGQVTSQARSIITSYRSDPPTPDLNFLGVNTGT